MATINEGYHFAVEHCPQTEYHGNPFRYCGMCGWMEDAPGPKEEKPVVNITSKSPDYVFDLVRAVKTGEPLDFQGHSVPADVQQELEKEWGRPLAHPCFINAEVDHLAYREQYLIGCQCHEGNVKHIWQPGDPPYVCPGSGITVDDPRTLAATNDPDEDPDGGE